MTISLSQIMAADAAHAEIVGALDGLQALGSREEKERYGAERLLPLLFLHRAIFDELHPLVTAGVEQLAHTALEPFAAWEQTRQWFVDGLPLIVELRGAAAVVGDFLSRANAAALAFTTAGKMALVFSWVRGAAGGKAEPEHLLGTLWKSSKFSQTNKPKPHAK